MRRTTILVVQEKKTRAKMALGRTGRPNGPLRECWRHGEVMLIGLVEGSVVSTIKHPSLQGWKVLIVQPLGPAGEADGDPLLAIDRLGAGRGMKVLITNDGRGAREMVDDKTSPVRWSVIGVLDEV